MVATRPITTHQAEVSTASVEIRTLTVRGKQVTQSMFRQLIEEPLIADDGTFRGNPWGTVNYHPDRCGDSRDGHLHVVWQQGGELRRARVAPPSCPQHINLEGEGDTWWLAAKTATGWALPLEWKACHLPPRTRTEMDVQEGELLIPVEHRRFRWVHTICVPEECATIWASTSFFFMPPGPIADAPSYRNESKARFDQALAEIRKGLSDASLADEAERAWQAMMAELDSEADRYDRHDQRWQEILNLPQLFIAT